MPDDDKMWMPPRAILVSELYELAKRFRLKAYFDYGDPEGEDEHTSAVREARTSSLIAMAEAIDEQFKFDSTLTKEDLEKARRY